MADSTKPMNIICFATFFKGGDFMRECKAEGCNVTLVTKGKTLPEDWPRDVLDEVFALPNDAPVELFLALVAHIAKTNQPDRIVALEEFDVVVAALAREHLCLPGMSSSTAKTFRDKYAMAVNARDAGLTVPEFVPAINNDEVAEYLNRVPAPWVMKRRLIKAMRMETGATHAEFIKSDADGDFYFLEIAARVGGAYIADVLEAASGINLWREWAKMELAESNTKPRLKPRKEHAGIILSLARQEWPDTSAYDDPEVVYRAK